MLKGGEWNVRRKNGSSKTGELKYFLIKVEILSRVSQYIIKSFKDNQQKKLKWL